MNQQGGYTLIELLVVLAIMGIMLAAIPGIALPAINSARFSGKIQDITQRLDQAHEEAIERGQAVRITTAALSSPSCRISPDGGVYFYPDGSASNGRLLVTYRGQSKEIFVNALTGIISVSNVVH